MYGSQSELIGQGVNPKQMLGTMSHTNLKKDRNRFSIDFQDDGILLIKNESFNLNLFACYSHRWRRFDRFPFSTPNQSSILSFFSSQPIILRPPDRWWATYPSARGAKGVYLGVLFGDGLVFVNLLTLEMTQLQVDLLICDLHGT